LPLELTFKILLLVGDLAHQFDITEPLAAVEVPELDQDLHSDHVGAELAHEADGGRSRPARSKNIIHDQDLLAGLDGVRVDLQLVGGRHRTERKYARVWRSPSSRPTSRCQPRNSRAWVMSGRRCLGSSTGSSRCSMRLLEPASRMIAFASSSTLTSSGLPR